MRFILTILFSVFVFCSDAQIIRANAYYTPLSQPLLLDVYTGSAAAYSLRKVRTAYTGAAIRVRRSSDNTEQDIGFAGVDLDTVSLKNFVGSNSGFITTWYDQSGNARNAIQNTAANQPRVVNAGNVERQNGKPSVFLDGTDRMTLTDFALPTSSIFAAAITTGTSPSALNIHSIYARGNNRTPSSTSRDAFLYVWRNNNRGEIQRSDGVTFPTAVVTATAANFNLYTGIFTGTQLIAYANGTVGTPVNTTISGTVSNGVSSIGCVFEVSTTTYFFVGRISEIIVYPSDQSSNRTGIETNINTYYAIY